MDFGSEYILDEEEEQEEEEMPVPVQHRSQRQMPPSYAMGDSGGFGCEIMEFDDEEEENLPQKSGKPKKVNTHTVNLTMESLTKVSGITLQMSQKLNCQGDKCGAIFSHLAKVEEKDGKKIWKCPFCYVDNEATGELPNLTVEQTDVMYVEDANKLPNLTPPQDKNDYSIIFVVDASASMCQTLEIPREGASKCLIELYDKGLQLQQQFLAQMSPDDSMRQMIQQMRSAATMEVTKMMLVKDAVITVLEDLKSKKPNVCVGLVVFNEKVMVLGDSHSKVEVDNEKLMDKTGLKIIGQQHSELRPISESADDLKREIEGLKEKGRTVLGPALLIAEKMASSKGSKVILLTDGCANIGLGKLEESTKKDVDEFYDNLIITCKMDGVSVSIISCDEAGIKTKLGDIPDETGGIVARIYANYYKTLLKEELERQAAATDGLLNFVVGKNMYVKLKDDSIKNSSFAKIIGNIHFGKKVPLEFAIQQSPDPQQQQTTSTPVSDMNQTETKPGDDPQPPSDSNMADSGDKVTDHSDGGEANTAAQPQQQPQAQADGIQCPFQVQIRYTDMYGTVAWRVWTKQRKLTKSRQQAVDGMNTKSAVTSFMQTAADKVLAANDTERLPVVLKLTDECKKWQSKLNPDDDRNNIKKLSDFQELLVLVAGKQKIDDDLSTKLRAIKEDRLVSAQA